MVPGHIDSIHAALADYTCIIEDLIVTESRAAAGMTFKGLHSGRFFEVQPTGASLGFEICAGQACKDQQRRPLAWKVSSRERIGRRHAHAEKRVALVIGNSNY
jgi:hypothetical protein